MWFKERQLKRFKISKIKEWKLKAYQWGCQFDYFSISENNDIQYKYSPFKNILAAGALEVFEENNSDVIFENLEKFLKKNKAYSFGYLSYDLKNSIENLSSLNASFQNSPHAFFFVPETIIFFYKKSILISSVHNPDKIFRDIDSTLILDSYQEVELSFAHCGKEKYIENVNKIKEHLLLGDIYELNYCIEFKKELAEINPLSTFRQLINISPMPFSFFLKNKDQYIICSSPERFLKKEGKKLISQPIKGTIKRGEDLAEDEILKEKLKNSEKEKAENLMIVDLVRNDLAKSSIPGSVKVEELFGIYTFEQMHQMISTIISVKGKEIQSVEIIKNAFPMGSMTGAPKIRAMELIEEYETSERGVFSGAGGYFTPKEDFDFNVIIRSIFYNSSTKRLSFQVGSAITYDADPEYEFEECMLKAKAILEILGARKQ